MKRLAVLVALFFVSCASGREPFSFAVDAAFPPERRDDLLHAMDTWNPVTLPEYQLDIDGDHWRALYAATPPGDCLGKGGCTQATRRTIWIRPGLGPVTYEVALHEFGHALGLLHTCSLASEPDVPVSPGAPPCGAESRGVMDADHASPTLTDVDLEECRRVGACPP